MKYNFFLFLFFIFFISSSQTINLNESYLTDYLRTSQLLGEFKSDVSFTLKPLDIGGNGLEINKEIFDTEKYAPTLLSFLKGNGKIKGSRRTRGRTIFPFNLFFFQSECKGS